MKNILIDVLAFGALLSSVLVITSKNPVIAVIFLISVFVNAAGYLILLGVGFIGISYIIVYVGAIAVLFLFVISSLFIYEIFTIIPFSLNNVSSISALLEFITNLNSLILNLEISTISSVNTAFNPAIADTNFTNFLQIQAIGQHLYTTGAFFLIIISVILLLAMV